MVSIWYPEKPLLKMVGAYLVEGTAQVWGFWGWSVHWKIECTSWQMGGGGAENKNWLWGLNFKSWGGSSSQGWLNS